jgi:hypothetical protein
MKYTIVIIFFIFCAMSFRSMAQHLEVQWAKQFGSTGWDYVNSMVPTAKGGYLLGGSLKGILPGDSLNAELGSSNNAWLISTDSNGVSLWQKTFGGKMFENITSMSQTPDGVLISGIFQDSLFFENLSICSQAFSNGYTALIDTNGTPVWITSTGGSATISHMLNICSPSGDLFVAAVFADSLNLNGEVLAQNGEKGIYCSQINTEGNVLRTLILKSKGYCHLGGLACTDSVLYLAGSFSDTLQITDTLLVAMGGEDVFIAAFSYAGALLKITSAGGMGNERVQALTLTPNQGVALTGWFDYAFLLDSLLVQGVGGKDIFVAALDSNLQALWLHSIGGLGDDYGYAITSNLNNEYFVSGNFVHYLQLSGENGNLVELDASSAFGNAFIAKYDSIGNLKASYNLPATSEDYAKIIIADTNGMITTAGSFFELMQLQGMGNGIENLATRGERDVFLLRFLDLCNNVSVDAGIDTAFCIGQSIILTAPAAFQYYRWLPEGLPNQDMQVQQAGTYKILITDFNGCIASDSIHVVEKPLSTAFAGNDTLIEAGVTHTTINASTNYASNVEWITDGSGYFSNPYEVSTLYSPSTGDISTGGVQLTLNATNTCGTVTDTMLLNIQQDNDGITVYPNPTPGPLTLVCTEGKTIISALITNQAGNVIENLLNVNNTALEFDLSTFPPGTFLFYLTTNTGIITKTINKL